MIIDIDNSCHKAEACGDWEPSGTLAVLHSSSQSTLSFHAMCWKQRPRTAGDEVSPVLHDDGEKGKFSSQLKEEPSWKKAGTMNKQEYEFSL